MEHVNNDMDDLFRKAGDLYPLKTSESDWDQVLGKLRGEIPGDQHTVPAIQARGSRNKSRWLLLLLLIPLGLFSLVYFSGYKIIQKPGHDSTGDHPLAAGRGGQTKKEPAITVEQAAGMPAPNPFVNTFLKDKDSFSKKMQGPSDNASLTGVSGKNDLHMTHTPAVPGAEIMKADTKSSFTDAPPLLPESFHEPLTKTISLSVYGPNETVRVHEIPFSTLPATGISLKDLSSGTISKSKSEKIQSSKGIYIGFLAGPDLSSVDFQSVKHPGFSLGVIAGYRFNRRLAIETGILWDKKYYYSTGNYFDKSKANIPASVTIINVDGNCNMFEIPLNLRYDFATKNKHSFFAKAGFSSYLMKKENYNYLAYGYSGQTYTHDSTYNNSTHNIFSILQISGGYEFAIGSKTKIQIEPYLKIPVQGIGIGSMPISSAGIYFGITHSFR
jgi:hypothetical protein